MVKLYEDKGFIWVMDKVKLTERGVVEGSGLSGPKADGGASRSVAGPTPAVGVFRSSSAPEVAATAVTVAKKNMARAILSAIRVFMRDLLPLFQTPPAAKNVTRLLPCLMTVFDSRASNPYNENNATGSRAQHS